MPRVYHLFPQLFALPSIQEAFLSLVTLLCSNVYTICLKVRRGKVWVQFWLTASVARRFLQACLRRRRRRRGVVHRRPLDVYLELVQPRGSQAVLPRLQPRGLSGP